MENRPKPPLKYFYFMLVFSVVCLLASLVYLVELADRLEVELFVAYLTVAFWTLNSIASSIVTIAVLKLMQKEFDKKG